jgi:hypothetical protein
MGNDTLVIREELMPPLPSFAVDLVKSRLLETRVTRSAISPILKWRRNQRLRR